MKIPLILFRTRVILALATLSLIGVFIYRTFLVSSSLAGVLCAPVTVVSSPIGGTISSTAKLAVGDRVKLGDTLVMIENRHFDDHIRLDAMQKFHLTEIERDRLVEQLQRAEYSLADENQRLALARGDQIEIFRRRLARDEHRITEAEIQSDDMRKQADRQGALAAQGFISSIASEAKQAASDEARQNVSALRSNLEADRRAYIALNRDSEIEDNALPQVGAVRARIANLKMQTRSLEPELKAKISQLAANQAALNAANELSKRLQSASIAANANGVVVHALSTNNLHTQSGTELFSYADCEHLHAMVLVKHRVYEKIRSGKYDKIGVEVGVNRYDGKVVAFSPSPFNEKDFFPTGASVTLRPDSAQEYGYVLVALKSGTQDLSATCPLGAPAKINID